MSGTVEQLRRLAAEVEAEQDDFELPAHFLRIRGLLNMAFVPLVVQEEMWKLGLLHVLLDTLKLDYWGVTGGYHTAAQLAGLFARCARGCPAAELLLLQPTNTLLSLAGMIQRVATARADEDTTVRVDRPQLQRDFRAVLDALATMQSKRSVTVPRLFTDPLFLHLLMQQTGEADEPDNASGGDGRGGGGVGGPAAATEEQEQEAALVATAISFLNETLGLQSRHVPEVPREALRDVCDELLLKVVNGRDPRVAGVAAKALLRLLRLCPDLIEALEGYGTLEDALTRWRQHAFWAYLEDLLALLEAHRQSQAVVTSDQRRALAAARLQGVVRGHQSRQQTRRMHAAVFRLQFLVRRFLRRRREDKAGVRARGAADMRRSEAARRQRLEATERSKRTLQGLPPGRVDGFLRGREEAAALRVQSWWRGEAGRRRCQGLRDASQRHKAAVRIQVQSTYRGYRARTRGPEPRAGKAPPRPRELDPAVRESLQNKIRLWQEENLVHHRPADEAERAHYQAQEVLLRHLQGRGKLWRTLDRIAAMADDMDSQLHTLKGVGGLDELQAREQSAVAPSVASEARLEHRTKLRQAGQAWWKTLAEDTERDRRMFPHTAAL